MRLLAPLILVALLPACAANPPAPAESRSVAQQTSNPTSRPAAAVATPAATLASNSPAATVAETKTVRKDGTQVYCRREDASNSRLRHVKVCLTREEWDQRATLAREAWTEQQRSGMPETGD